MKLTNIQIIVGYFVFLATSWIVLVLLDPTPKHTAVSVLQFSPIAIMPAYLMFILGVIAGLKLKRRTFAAVSVVSAITVLVFLTLLNTSMDPSIGSLVEMVFGLALLILTFGLFWVCGFVVTNSQRKNHSLKEP
jgi:predicted neutral ceramidase superfamily lipid hydrolase